MMNRVRKKDEKDEIGKSRGDKNDLNGELMDASVNHKDGLSDSEALQPQSRVCDGMSETVRDGQRRQHDKELASRVNSHRYRACRANHCYHGRRGLLGCSFIIRGLVAGYPSSRPKPV
jgi:hypothetical protein